MSTIGETSTFAEFSPATYHQFVSLLIEKMAAESLPELVGIIRLRGQLNNPGAAKGNQFYGVKISDDGGAQAKADIPSSLILGRGVQAGQQVVVTGRVAIRSSQYGVEARLVATDIQLLEEQAVRTVDSDQGRITIERLRSLPAVRNGFPAVDPIRLTLIQSSSAQVRVAMDAQSELEKVGDFLQITPVPINMLDPVAIARAIRQATADIVMVIRGGGASEDFAVFDDPRVIQSFAECRAHRVVGLGHSGNGCLLDLLADAVANTPGQAGCYVREKIEMRLRHRQEVLLQNKELKEKLQKLEAENEEAKMRITLSAKKIPAWFAFAIGILAGWLLLWLVR